MSGTSGRIRVLHLTSEVVDFDTERSANSLLTRAGHEFDVICRSIGPGGSYRNLAAAVLGLRSQARAYGVVHAWGQSALTAAALAGAGPLLFTPMGFLGRRGVAWLRAVMSCRDVHVVCPTATQRRACVEQGVPINRCHLIHPGVDFSRVRPRRDPALRNELGLADGDYVLLAAGESTRAAAHEQAVWAASILHVLDPKWKVLLWGRGAALGRVVNLGADLAQPDLLRVAERRLGRAVAFEELLPAADAVLVPAVGPVPTLPIATSMAAALPIVATVTYTSAELLEDRHTALMCPRNKPRLLARRVLDLQEDPQVQWAIRDQARTEAYEYFPLTRFLNQYRAVYRQLAAGEKGQTFSQTTSNTISAPPSDTR
jgi:glycosyltransferase involved in cell wall biosynthesis